MAETNLRQATAKATSVGIVSEKDLKIETTDDGKTQIVGYVTVKTGPTNFIRYNVRVSEKTSAGTENRAYSGIETVMNEYKSIAEVGEELADKVRVSGDLNLYHSVNTNSDVMSYRASFFNRLRSEEEYEPKAEYEVETFISAIVPEMNNEGDETGRVIVKGWVPTYNGIEAITMVADAETGSAIESMFEPGQTVTFYGEIINSRVVVTKEIPVAIGKPKIKTETTIKNELLITGASEAYEEDSNPAAYDQSTIKAAVQERENRIVEAKAKAQENRNNGSAGKTASTRPTAKGTGRTLDF